MFDFAWSELMLIGIVALIVIGPKDLPRVLRMAGKWVSQARAVAREFQGSLEQMIRESELDDVRREVEKVATTDIGQHIEKSIDPSGELQSALAPPELTDGTTMPSTNGAAVAIEPPAPASETLPAETPPTETPPTEAKPAETSAIAEPEAPPQKTGTSA